MGKRTGWDHPIILSMSEIQAVLRGDKTSLRRIVEPPLPKAEQDEEPFRFIEWQDGMAKFTDGVKDLLRHPICKPNDLFWVQETFATNSGEGSTVYRASYEFGSLPKEPGWRMPWQMRRPASRINLRVKEIRAESLGDICEEDALAEGCVRKNGKYKILGVNDAWDKNYKAAFQGYWDAKFHEIGGLPWSPELLVWVVTFTPELMEHVTRQHAIL